MATIDFNDSPEVQPSRTQQKQAIYRLNDGQVIAVSQPPMTGQTDCEFAVTRAVAILSDFIDRNTAIAGDATLSPMGKQAKQRPLALAAVKALHAVDDKLVTFGGQQLNKLMSLYTVPAIAPGNAVQALLDREVREWWRGLSATARGNVMPKLVSGQLPEVAVALQRSPIPLDSDEQLIANAWKATVRAQNIGEVTDLEQISQTVTWADLLVRRVAAMLVRAAGLPDNAVGDLLREIDAGDKGPFNVNYRNSTAAIVAA